MAKKRILVAMSGGVDSSTAAAILKSQGHEVVGMTLKLYSAPSGKGSLKSCCGFEPANDARKVCDILGCRHVVVNAEKLFQERVVHHFCDEYRAGRTPNPCIRCNTYLKFDFLLEKARSMGLDYVATGHYAVTRNRRLYSGLDSDKDQSYFLYTLNPETLPSVLFPLGTMRKDQTRQQAAAFHLPVRHKRESQDICFIPGGDYRSFLESRGLGTPKGYILDRQGSLVGEHRGLHAYTVGQRKGLGPLGERTFVLSINPKANTLTVGNREALRAGGFSGERLTWCHDPVVSGQRCGIRVRYRSRPVPGIVQSVQGQRVEVRFDRPADSVTPGQAAVFYRDNEVLGGAVITGKRD